MKTIIFIITGILLAILVCLGIYWKYQAHQAYFKNEGMPDDRIGTINNQASSFLDSSNNKRL